MSPTDTRLRGWQLACPDCRRPLRHGLDGTVAYCDHQGLRFEQIDGIWRFLVPDRAPNLARFIEEYETVRINEGRGSDNPDYYQALPELDLSDVMPTAWQERTRSFEALKEHINTNFGSKPLRIIDCGAGNGWLSNRLTAAGHKLAAIDLCTNPLDGLGAFIHYKTDFLPLQAEFERLPLLSDQADLVIFNAAFHYTANPAAALNEAKRVLRPGGEIILVDTPFYHNQASGQGMVQTREADFQKRYGFAGNAHNGISFLTYERLSALGKQLDISWEQHNLIPSWRRLIRQGKVALRGQREPAQFPLVVGKPLSVSEGRDALR